MLYGVQQTDVSLHGKQQNNDYADCMEVAAAITDNQQTNVVSSSEHRLHRSLQHANHHTRHVEEGASSGNDHGLKHDTEIEVLLDGEPHAGNQQGRMDEAAVNCSNHRL